ncbi:hypothetical protein SAMN04487926_14042 [Paraburkholderia steynii]|uniref:Uncharacterized protein n=2 Tax=Paraburkholderia steynii TaxID=1245441 RepID=A0A7Z7FNZ0_9BURK|nr:hypothetical protein SAMN04487926_14042 [Paraburkholderia steynii]
MNSESAIGYNARSTLIEQCPSFASKVQETLGTNRLRFGSLPGNLARFARETCGVLGATEEILDGHTTIPVPMHLVMMHAQRESLITRIKEGERCDRALWYQALGKGPYRTRSTYPYCQTCARVDEAAVGFPYWRIEWLYPGIAACPIHCVSLTIGCGRCKESQPFNSRLRMPSTECSCGNLATPLLENGSTDLDTHIRIATIMSEAQSTGRFFADECDLGALFRQRARDLGFKKGALLDRVSLNEQFTLRYGTTLLKNLGLVVPGNAPSFVECLSEGGQQKDVLRAAFLVDFLFKSFNHFSDAVTNFTSTGEEQTPPRRLPRGQGYSEEKLSRAAARVSSFVRRNPGATRTEILMRCRYAAGYLMRHSRDTYEQIAPQSRRRVGYTVSRPSRMAKLDAVLISYVTSRKDLLRSGPAFEWRPLTARRLLLGHPVEKNFRMLEADLPKTSQLILRLTGNDDLLNRTPNGSMSRRTQQV